MCQKTLLFSFGHRKIGSSLTADRFFANIFYRFSSADRTLKHISATIRMMRNLTKVFFFMDDL